VKDGRPLAPIANELFLDIFDYIAPGPSFTTEEVKDMHRALSRTCRFFASVCIPRLFREIDYTPSSPAPIFAWAQMIQKNQPEALAIGQHVESLSFRDWSSKDSQLFLNFGMATLTRVSRLAHLSFYGMKVSREAIDAIANMDDLNSLHLEYCSFDPDDLLFARSRVRELTIYHGTWSLSHIEEAVTRLMDPQALRVFRTNGSSSLQCLIRSGAAFPALEVLEITSEGMELPEQQLLAEFFHHTPALRVLVLDFTELEAPLWQATVPPDALHQLSRLEAPSELLLKLGCDRPISFLSLLLPQYTSGHWYPIPEPLGSSFPWETLLSRLVELEVPVAFEMPCGILVHAARLEVLTINCEDASLETHEVRHAPTSHGPELDRALQKVELILEHLKDTPPKLRRLSLDAFDSRYGLRDFVVLNLPQQFEIVLQVAEMAPSLVDIIVGPCICWKRDARGLSSGSLSWRPTVISKEELRAMFTLEVIHLLPVADYDGLLRRTLTEDIAAGMITCL
jgi:hypothetical protein